MPLLVPTEDLMPGMTLTEGILEDGRVMLRGGLALSAADIRVLRRRYPDQRMRVGDPVLDSVIEFEDDTRERNVAAQVRGQVAECIGGVHARFAERASLTNVHVGALRAAVRDLLGHLKTNKVSATLVASCLDPKSYLSQHTSNVFYLSMLLGFKTLDYVVAERKRQSRLRNARPGFAEDLVPLGLGAMLMDLGLQPLQHLLQSDRPLSDEDRRALLRHPRVGVDRLPERMSALARMIVRAHHENCAGTGYPKRLPREKLHVFTRIVRIADAFDAATSSAVYRMARSPAQALWEMTAGPYRRYYDPHLAAAFAGVVQPFPVGCKLKLSDGRYAVVVKYNRRHAFNPLVIIAFDRHGQTLPRAELVGPLYLSDRADLRLVAHDREDLSFLYSDPDAVEHDPDACMTPFAAAYP